MQTSLSFQPQKRLKAITWRKIGENCAFTDLQRLQQFFFHFLFVDDEREEKTFFSRDKRKSIKFLLSVSHYSDALKNINERREAYRAAVPNLFVLTYPQTSK